MKIWNEFSSSHSSDIAVVGKFENVGAAEKAFPVIEDFALASWEERYPSIKEFGDAWQKEFPDLKYVIGENELDMGIDNTPTISMSGTSVEVSELRHFNIGGLIKLFIMTGAKSINVTP